MRRALTVALVASLASVNTAAAQFPLWEAGAGVAGIRLPDYRGSNEYRNYALPFPYIVYRGEILQVDRNKVRGLLFKTDRVELDVSVNGSVPVDSEKNQARRGMPDLDPTLELGPSLNVSLYRDTKRRFEVDLRLPVRAVLATDFSDVHYAGLIAHPHLNIDVWDVFPGPGWRLGLLAGPLFGSRQYHEYFYRVDQAFATAGRPAYETRGGYSGVQAIAALSKRFPRFWFGAFIKADSLHGAAFEDSPLVKAKSQVVGGFAIAWVFAQSQRMVEARD